MNHEVKPMTITALHHCIARLVSCSGRKMAVEKIMMMVRYIAGRI